MLLLGVCFGVFLAPLSFFYYVFDLIDELFTFLRFIAFLPFVRVLGRFQCLKNFFVQTACSDASTEGPRDKTE